MKSHRASRACTVIGAVALLAGVTAFVLNGLPVTIGAYTTSLSERSPEQLHNIRRAAASIDGAVIRPGDEFSFNRTVGGCTVDRGYVPAPAFLGAEVGDTPGGGVCQLSSTLYNACLLAGLGVTERHAHTYPVRSVPPGRDATVSFGGADLRVRSPFPEPVRISARMSGQRLVVAVHGNRSFRPNVRVMVETDGPSRAVSAGGGTGFVKATVWREELRDGHVVRREFVSSDRYAVDNTGG